MTYFFMWSNCRTNYLVIIPTRTHLDIEDVLDMTLLYWQTVLLILRFVYAVVRMGVDLNFIFFSVNSRLIFRWSRFHIDRGCGTLILDCWNKDFRIYPDDIDWVLMVLSMLDTRYRDSWDQTIYVIKIWIYILTPISINHTHNNPTSVTE